MPEEANPFDVSSYSNTPIPQETQATEVVEETASTELPATEPPTTTEVNTEVKVEEPKVETKVEEPTQVTPAETPKAGFEWQNEVAKTIYDSLVSGNISEVADMMYEQKVLSELDKMNEADIIKLNMAYNYPDLSPQEIEEEFASKYSVDKDFDKTLMSDEEIASKMKQLEKQEKSVAREMKKDVREAKESLQSLKKDISFPDILSQFQQQSQAPVNNEEIVNQYLTAQKEEQEKVYNQAREVYEKSIDDGLKSFEGFNVNYKDEDVQFDGKYALTQEDKVQLQDTMKSFDLESFYGSRYYKDGKYDTKQIAEDIYFLQNRDKVVNSMVTQAVSKAKSDILKGMKNIDYSNSSRPASVNDTNDMDKMVDTMFRL